MSTAYQRALLATWLDMPEAQIEADMRLVLNEIRAHRESIRLAKVGVEAHLIAGDIAKLLGDDREPEDVILTELYLALHRYREPFDPDAEALGIEALEYGRQLAALMDSTEPPSRLVRRLLRHAVERRKKPRAA